MTKDEMATFMEDVIFPALRGVRESGQKEYAHTPLNAFANFERVSERMGNDRKEVLMVYLEKHLDGIHSFIQGNVSQREPVQGRIKDAIMYLCLLWGMINEDEGKEELPF
jgi:hypothetical protein